MFEQKGEGSDITCFFFNFLETRLFISFQQQKMFLSRRVELFCSVNADLAFFVFKTKGTLTFCFKKNPSMPLVLILRQYPVW